MKNKLLILILGIFVFLFNVNVVNAKVTTYDRNNYQNLGVNKKIEINASNRQNIMNTALVDARDKVYDFADILTEEEESLLREQIDNFMNNADMDVVILTINQAYTYDKYNENIAADFYDYNDFGIDFHEYSGILLLRNAYNADPYYEIYTFGDAQLYFDSVRFDYMLDHIEDDIGNKNYFSAFTKFINDVDRYYSRGFAGAYKNYYIDENGRLVKKFVPPLFLAFVIALSITIIVIRILIKRNKLVIKPTKANEYLDPSSVNFTEKSDVFRNSITTSYTQSSSGGGSGGHSGGGHSSGSSGRSHSSSGGRHR